MGTPEFAVPSLIRIAASEFGKNVSLVVTSPDKPRRTAIDNPTPTPVKALARRIGYPVYEIEDLNSAAFADRVRAVAPDIIVIVAFRILPKEIFSLPTIGTFNLHASLLPKYRGAAPINWALIAGETETGVTTFFLQEKVDTGNIILQKSLDIEPEEVATDLTLRLAELGADAVLETLRLIRDNRVELQAQDNSLATKAPKLFKDNTRIDWTKPALSLQHFIRGLADKPAAWTTLNGKDVKIYCAQVADAVSQTSHLPAGAWLTNNQKLFVVTGDPARGTDGTLEILSLQTEGKKRLAAADFLRGFRLTGSERFE